MREVSFVLIFVLSKRKSFSFLSFPIKLHIWLNFKFTFRLSNYSKNGSHISYRTQFNRSAMQIQYQNEMWNTRKLHKSTINFGITAKQKYLTMIRNFQKSNQTLRKRFNECKQIKKCCLSTGWSSYSLNS